MKLLPWLLAVGFAGLTAYLAICPPNRSTPVPPVVVTATAPPSVAEELAALRRCTSRLEVAQDALQRSEDIRGGRRADRAAAILPDTGPCAGDAAALAELEARIEAEVAARVIESTERRLTARDGRRAEVRHMVEQFLAIDDAQSSALMEYVCAVREQRADVIDDVRTANLDLKGAAERQEAQRQEILVDIEHLLGHDKYTQLRSVGGLGKLGDLFECG